MEIKDMEAIHSQDILLRVDIRLRKVVIHLKEATHRKGAILRRVVIHLQEGIHHRKDTHNRNTKVHQPLDS